MRILALAPALFLVAACSAGAPPADEATDAAATPGAQQTVPAATGEPTVAATPAPQGNPAETFIAWIVGLGPGSPEGPTQVDTYKLIREASLSSCRQALDPELDVPETKALYHGAAAGCLAALHGRSDRWHEAVAAFESLPGRPANCVDQATFDLLQAIVEAHEVNPNGTFTREGTPAEGQVDRIRLRCLRIDDVTVTRSPTGLEIRVPGNRLDQAIAISYASVESCPQSPDFESQLKLEPEGDNDLLYAAVEGDAEAAAGTWLWVGVLSEPVDWVAASDCVEIQDGP